jgi:hypothetical protein
MSAAKVNLPVIEQGATYRHTLYWKDAAGLAIDLFACTAKMQIRVTADSSAVICELSTVNGRLILTATEGKIELVIPSSVTKAIKPITAVYDLEVSFTNGDVIRLIEGSVVVKAEVTRG